MVNHYTRKSERGKYDQDKPSAALKAVGEGVPLQQRVWSSSSHSSATQRPARSKVPIKYEIRPMERKDIEGLYKLTSSYAWNMEMDYLKCIFDTDPSGLVMVVTPTGEVIGHNGILAHSPKVASSGMNIVKEEHRSKGIGKELFRSVMEVMKDRNVGGTALTNRITFYEQFGWTIPSFTLHYNMGPINPSFVQKPRADDFNIVPVDEINFNDVVIYDAELHTIPRPKYLRNWVQGSSAKAFAAVKNGKVRGYSVLRPADIGFRLYPLYADSDKIAHALFCTLASYVPENGQLIFTNPIENKSACEFVTANNFKFYLSMTRLYNKWDIPVDINRVYSVSSTEYGIV